MPAPEKPAPDLSWDRADYAEPVIPWELKEVPAPTPVVEVEEPDEEPPVLYPILDNRVDGGGGGTGTVGPAGPTGPEGPAGPPGADGAPGKDGVDGAPGKDGVDGAPGADGVDGADGAPGAAATVTVGTTVTGAPTDPAAVSNSGDQNAAVLDFVIPQGIQGPQGVPGIQGQPGLGITFRGGVQTEAELPATAVQGDLYVVAEPAPAHGFVWDADAAGWIDAGPVQGPQGVPGEQGLPGRDGADGADSTVPGPAGADGVDGAPGPTAVSVDAGNATKLGSDGLIYTPAPTAVTGFLPLTGGEMTGTITLPAGSNGLAIKGTTYNLLGGSGGVAFRNGSTNIMTFAASTMQATVPIQTVNSATALQFGSGGPTLGRGTNGIQASTTIDATAAPTVAGHLTNKAYVDSTVAAAAVANPVGGSVPDVKLWLGSQAAYDAITPDAKTIYYIV